MSHKGNNSNDYYGKDYVRIKANSDYDTLPFEKKIKMYVVILIRSVFEDDDIFFPQVFLEEFL